MNNCQYPIIPIFCKVTIENMAHNVLGILRFYCPNKQTVALQGSKNVVGVRRGSEPEGRPT